MFHKCPGHFEPVGKVARQRLDAEGLSRVMAAVQNIQAEVFGHAISPMRPFASDKGIHTLIGRLLQSVSRPAAHDADATADLRTAGNQPRLRPCSALQAPDQVRPRNVRPCLKAEEQAVVEVERTQLFQAQRGREQSVVAQPGVGIQRQVRAVNREVMLYEAADQLVAFARPRVRRAPKEPVMHHQQVRFSRHRQPDGRERRVHGRGDPRYGPIILNLKAVGSALVILHLRRTQQAVAVANKRRQGSF